MLFMVWALELVQVTVWPETLAVAEVALGHAVGEVPGHDRLVVEMLAVCQFEAVVSITKLVGKVTDQVLTSVELVAGLAQIVPVVVWLTFMRSKRTATCERAAACVRGTRVTVNSPLTAINAARAMCEVFLFFSDSMEIPTI